MSWLSQKNIFLDYASATPVLSEVKSAMEKYWFKDFFNASAIYAKGLRIRNEVDEYRLRMARSFGVSSQGVIFTASGTESNNLAIIGTFQRAQEIFKSPHLVISSIEHPSVLVSAKEVERRGGKVSIIDVDEEGRVKIEALAKIIKKETFLVSVGLANSEIGTVQSLTKIGRLLGQHRKKNESGYPYFHSDASQAVNYLETQLQSLKCDLLTIDSSKIYGPKGIGALIVNKSVEIHPIIFGGIQEGGRRAGTSSPALIAGFATALKIAQSKRESEKIRLEILRKEFIESVTRDLPEAVINGSWENHLPNIVSVSVPGTISELVLLKLEKEGILVSVGTACSYDEKESGSPVIKALGKGALAESTLRFSFGQPTTLRDVRKAAEKFCRVSKSVLKSIQ